MALKTSLIPTEEATVNLFGTSITDFIAGDYIEITMQNNKSEQKFGSNTTVTQKNVTGDAAQITLNVMMLSGSDAFLNNTYNQSSPVVQDGSIKRFYTKNGISNVETLSLSNATIQMRNLASYGNQAPNESIQYIISCEVTRQV